MWWLLFIAIYINGMLLWHVSMYTLPYADYFVYWQGHIDSLGTSVFSRVPDIALFGIGWGTVLLMCLFGFSNAGQRILLIFLNTRRATLRELEQINPLLEEVVAQAKAKIPDFKYNLKKIKVWITDKKVLDAQALGGNTIILSRGLLVNSSDEELKAVLAHELGHLYNKDGLLLVALFYSSFTTLVAWFLFVLMLPLWEFGLSSQLSLFRRINIKADGGNIGVMLVRAFILAFFFACVLPFFIVAFVYSRLLKLTILLVGKLWEYRADKFAAILGYKEGLVSFLERTEALTETDNSLLGMIFASHPAPMKRIDKLDRLESAGEPKWWEGYLSLDLDNKLLSVVGVLSLLLVIYWSYNSYKFYEMRHALKKTASVPAVVAAKPVSTVSRKPVKWEIIGFHLAKPKSEAKPQGEPWVYIYSSRWRSKTKKYVTYYKVRNKGGMQSIEVKKELPYNSKMSLKDLQALQ